LVLWIDDFIVVPFMAGVTTGLFYLGLDASEMPLDALLDGPLSEVRQPREIAGVEGVGPCLDAVREIEVRFAHTKGRVVYAAARVGENRSFENSPLAALCLNRATSSHVT
jgi:hypothetical protein